MSGKNKGNDSKTSHAVATIKSEMTREDIPSLIDNVNKKLEELKGNCEEKPQTIGKSIPQFGRIEELDSLNDLVQAHASIKLSIEKFEKSLSIIPEGIKKPKYQIEGVDGEVWLKDIEARVKIVANKKAIEKLEKIKTTLENNLSAEEKWRRDMSEIAKELTDEEGI